MRFAFAGLVGAVASHPRFDGSSGVQLDEMMVGSGVCQAVSEYEVFDLSDFDKVNRDSGEPSIVSGYPN